VDHRYFLWAGDSKSGPEKTISGPEIINIFCASGPKFFKGLCSDGPCEYRPICQILIALAVPEIIVIAALGLFCEPPVYGRGGRKGSGTRTVQKSVYDFL